MSRLFKAHKPKSPAKASDPVAAAPAPKSRNTADPKEKRPKEIGGPAGPEPTRYGDWERKGICVDF